MFLYAYLNSGGGDEILGWYISREPLSTDQLRQRFMSGGIKDGTVLLQDLTESETVSHMEELLAIQAMCQLRHKEDSELAQLMNCVVCSLLAAGMSKNWKNAV